MIEYRSDCVGCESCVAGCSRKRYKALVCDICEKEVERLYWFDGEQICEDCVLDGLEVVDPED